MCIFECGAMVAGGGRGEGARKWQGRDKMRKWGMGGGG